jgi:hypothetical protein
MASTGQALRGNDSNSTLLLEPAQTSQQDRQPWGAVSVSRAECPKPAWWLLYAVLPLTILLFMLADLVPATSGWRSVSELLASFVVIGAISLWVRENRTALILADQNEPRETIRELP